MASTDGSVTIAIEMNIDEAEKEITSLRKHFFDLEKEIGLKNVIKDSIGKQAAEAAALLDAAQEKLRNMKKAASLEYSQKAIRKQAEKVKFLQKEYDKVAGEEEKITAQIERTNLELEYTKERIGEVQKEKERLQQVEENNYRYISEETAKRARITNPAEVKNGKIDTKELDAVDKAKVRLLQFKDSIQNALVEVVKASINVLGAGLKRLPSLIKSAFSNGLQFVKTFGKGIFSVAKRLNVFSVISQKIGPSFARLGSMIKRAFVFGVVTKGLNYMRSQMGTLIGKNAEFMAALNQLKGVFLTAFQPIYDVIMPALTALVNGLSRVVAVVAQFIAALFGKTAKQAQTSAKALNSEAKALSGTGEAAKEAAGSLASFDEINTIQTENAQSSGGGGGGSAGSSAAFDFGFGDQTPFETWGEAFNAFLDTILASIPRLRAALLQFAANLNVFTGKLLEMFTFPGVEQKVILLGKQIAMAFNAMVRSINWEQLGQALGAGLNLALLFLVNLIYTFDWLSLGSALAEAFNGLVSQIDWGAFGQLLWSGFKIGIETLAGFLLNTDMTQLAHAASELAIGFFNSISETINNIKWEQLGAQIAEFLANIDWAGIMESLFAAIGGLLGGLWAFLVGLIGDAISGIGEYFDEKIQECGGDIVAGILKGIWDALTSIGDWIYQHLWLPLRNAFCKAAGIASPSTEAEEWGGFLMEGLKLGITNKISAVIQTFQILWSKIQEVFAHISEWFSEKFSKAWQAVKDVFSKGGEIFSGIKEGILEGLKAVVNAIIDGINKVIAVPFNGLNSALRSIRNVNILGLKPFSWISTISVPQIPRLAQGAVIPPNREFMAVLGDQRNGNNIEAPESLIRQIVREETAGSSALLSQILSAIREGKVLVVDRQVLARVAVRGINDLTMQAGHSVLKI